jgi:hypothetical protein
VPSGLHDAPQKVIMQAGVFYVVALVAGGTPSCAYVVIGMKRLSHASPANGKILIGDLFLYDGLENISQDF